MCKWRIVCWKIRMEGKVNTTFRVFLVERKIRPKQTESLKT